MLNHTRIIMAKPFHQLLTTIIPLEHRWKIPLLSQWESIIGNLKDKVILEKITHDSLVLSVCHASWAQELLMLTPFLKKKINKILGEEKIKTIRFKTIDFKKRSERQEAFYSSSIRQKRDDRKLERMPDDVNLSIQESIALAKIEQEDLRRVMARFALRCKRIVKKSE